MNAIHEIKHAAILVAVKTSIELLEEDPQNNSDAAMDLLDRLTPKNWFTMQRSYLKEKLSETESPWHTLMLSYFALPSQERSSFLDSCSEDTELRSGLCSETLTDRDISVVFSLLKEQGSVENSFPFNT